jgi:hypothetical protein
MDKELAQLHDLARQMLLEIQAAYEAKVLPPGFGKSDKKRLDKAISNLDFNPGAYGDIMEDVISANLGPKELMKRIRNVENSVMRAFELLNEDTIHHLVQQRTGGDFSKKVSGSMVRGAIRRLEDRFGLKFSQATGPGGVVRGDTALSNYAHKSDLTQKGAELESGIGKNPDPSTTAHRQGTRGYSRTLTAAETADEDALVEALAKLIQPQLDDVNVGIATDAPRVQAIRLIPGLEDAYKKANTAEQIASMQKIARSPSVRDLIVQSYGSLLRPRNGALALTPFLPAQIKGLMTAGQVALDAGAAKAAFEQAQQPMSRREELATALEGISATTGLASLAPPAAPIAGPVSMGTGVAAMAVRAEADKKIPQAIKQFQEVERQVFPWKETLDNLPGKALNGLMRLSDMIPVPAN